MSDMVHHPLHYSADRFGIECIEFTRHMSFNIRNAFKYIFRHLDKGTPRQDLEKSLVYIGWAMEDRTPAYGGEMSEFTLDPSHEITVMVKSS